MKNTAPSIFILGLLSCLVLAEPPSAGHGGPGGGGRLGGPPRKEGAPAPGGNERCTSRPQGLADFANGEEYDWQNLVPFITSSSCLANYGSIARSAVGLGVNFSTKAPLRLDMFSKQLTANDLTSSRRNEGALYTAADKAFKETALTSTEILPLVGQLALLSPKAARLGIITVIKNETLAAEERLSQARPSESALLAADLAHSLDQIGASDPLLAAELAEEVERWALQSNGEALGSFFKGLSYGVQAENTLAPTFNLAAAAFYRGVRKSQSTLSDVERNRLLLGVFAALQGANRAPELLETSLIDLNESVGILAREKSFSETSLKSLWREAMLLLSDTASQPMLASLVAKSIVPQAIFLNKADRDLLLTVSRTYRSIALALEENLLFAWAKLWDQVQEQKVTVAYFNQMREKFFEPLMAGILEFESSSMDPRFIKETVRIGLVSDADVEKRFPRYALGMYEVKRSANEAGKDQQFQRQLSSMATDIAVHWAMYFAYLPPLDKWVKKYDK